MLTLDQGRLSTHSGRLIFYKADSQRMSLIGDRGEQRECRELPGTIIIEFLQRAAATIVGW